MVSREERRAEKRRHRGAMTEIIRLQTELQLSGDPADRMRAASELAGYADSSHIYLAMDYLGAALEDKDERVRAAAKATIEAVGRHDPELARRATGVGPPGAEKETIEIAPRFALMAEVIELMSGRCGVCGQETGNPVSMIFYTGLSESQGKSLQPRAIVETFKITDLQVHPWRICDKCANAARDPVKRRRREYFASLGITRTVRRYEDLTSIISRRVFEYLDQRRCQKPDSYWIKSQEELLRDTQPGMWKTW